MKRIAIAPFLLVLVFVAACKDDYIGNNPIPPGHGAGSYSIAYGGEDNSISLLDPDGGGRRSVLPADNIFRRVLDAVGGKIFYSEMHPTAVGTEKLIFMIDVDRNTTTKLAVIESDPGDNPYALPMAAASPDGKNLVVITEGPLAVESGLDSTRTYLNVLKTDQGDFPQAASTQLGAIMVGSRCNTRPCFSPDGQTIAFCYYIGSSQAKMMTVGIDGRNQLDFGQVGMGYLTADRSSGPTWSPDGTRLALLDQDGISVDIYNAATGVKLSTTPSVPAGGAALRALFWSPTDERFAAVMDGWGIAGSPYRGYRLYTLGLDGAATEMVRFSEPGGADSMNYMDYVCDWSQDGQRIIFLGQPNGWRMKGYDLYVTDSGDKHRRHLAERVVDALWIRSDAPAL